MNPNDRRERNRIQRLNSYRYKSDKGTEPEEPLDEDDELVTIDDVAYEFGQVLVDLCDAFRAAISAELRSELLSAVDTREVLAQNASAITDGNFSGTESNGAESATETLSDVDRATTPEWSLSDIPPEKRYYLFPALQILYDHLPHGLALADLFSAFEDAGHYRFELPASDAEASEDA